MVKKKRAAQDGACCSRSASPLTVGDKVPTKQGGRKPKVPKEPDAKPKVDPKSSSTAPRANAAVSTLPLATSGEEDRRKLRKLDAKKQSREEAATERLIGELMEGPPGIASPRPLPLRLMMRHRSVAWQWTVKGKLQYPIPIGSTRPLSPFSSDV
mmetsp:Transcript_49047/g.110292  ORF Transcript_49047/g.110292 Transcript_49047/m.110292 type:complete len:155 (-) Transcript_49047:73-537(-)|eukprot:CAMPEP_0197911978 /NCGR_PEP_ID=MMETSP1439-20131203/73910_1 /TAXON_ID=66791 /ORGANISM="Gonyaulax spinifera, Strain CCMP409" /LENGTH=154 /DNA_ID=CAMNT_0043533743 /DNA_START=103 /DNA_END=567 /DNA_ORIENTATION=+